MESEPAPRDESEQIELARLAVEQAFSIQLPDLRVDQGEEALIAKEPWAACIGVQLGADGISEYDRLAIKESIRGRLPYVQVWGERLVIGFAVKSAGDDDRDMVDDFAFRVAERLGSWPHGVLVSRIEYANAEDLFPKDVS